MSRCAACGSEFSCGMADGKDDAPCWCTTLPAALPLPDETGMATACYCPLCLQRRINDARRTDVP